MTVSIDAEKAFHRTLYCFTINTLNKLGIEGNFLDPTKGINEKPTVSIIRNGKRRKAASLPPKIRNNPRMSALITSFNIVLKVLAEQLGKKIKKEASGSSSTRKF